MAPKRARAPRRPPWLLVVGAVLCLAPLPFLPHALAPGALDAPELLDPGGHEYVHGSFDAYPGDVIQGHVTVLSGPAVNLYIMNADEFEGLRVASLTNASLTLSGVDFTFSFRAPSSGTYHLVVGHTRGNESVASSIHVQAAVLASGLLLTLTIVPEAAGVVLVIVGIRRGAQRALAGREAESPRGRRGRKKRP